MNDLLKPIARGYAGSCRYGRWKGHDVLDCTTDFNRRDASQGKLVCYVVVENNILNGWIPAEEFDVLDPKPWLGGPKPKPRAKLKKIKTGIPALDKATTGGITRAALTSPPARAKLVKRAKLKRRKS